MGLLKKVDAGLHGYERLGAWIGTTIVIAAPIAAAVIWLGNHQVAAWVPVAVGVPLGVLVVVAFAIGRSSVDPVAAPVDRTRERELEVQLAAAEGEKRAAVDATVESYKAAVGRVEYEKRVLTEALESVQYALGTEEFWDINALVERGVLGLALGLLVRSAEEDVRLAVLVPADDPPVHFKMRWAAGHRPESVQNYMFEIDKTLAGIAFSRGEYVDRPTVTSDDDFVENPKATRPFASLVAVPLRIEERIVGVLSVVSTVETAFTQADVSFIKAIGALLDVILAAEFDFSRYQGLMAELAAAREEDEP